MIKKNILLCILLFVIVLLGCDGITGNAPKKVKCIPDETRCTSEGEVKICEEFAKPIPDIPNSGLYYWKSHGKCENGCVRVREKGKRADQCNQCEKGVETQCDGEKISICNPVTGETKESGYECDLNHACENDKKTKNAFCACSGLASITRKECCTFTEPQCVKNMRVVCLQGDMITKQCKWGCTNGKCKARPPGGFNSCNKGVPWCQGPIPPYIPCNRNEQEVCGTIIYS